jgi:hypothetical protein
MYKQPYHVLLTPAEVISFNGLHRGFAVVADPDHRKRKVLQLG